MISEVQENLSIIQNEIQELEAVIKVVKSKTVTDVLQDAIEQRRNQIDKMKPESFVLIDITLKDGTELRQCLLLGVNDRREKYVVTDSSEAREMIIKKDEVYLKQENKKIGCFAGNIKTSDIDMYSISYTDEANK
ncbi:hypothetical protein QL818_09480 [Bacillus altitudinis]|uniref:hypothetical protein n=1 Tax=Bacillus altitudinis TaxID=293387 RepID=UPI0024A7F8F5|nr:hypothetical protein [Bacillus altitudinis]MDI6647292.1 hypothetical protein [Bacillus altitudinis]MDI6661914.1 hypothetical protein [Bacillus altitudinis]